MSTARRGDVVVVTGASAGIGRAIAEEFARHGARLALLARSPQRLEVVRRSVVALGGEAIVCPLDVADADAVEQAAERIERELGPIDIWINNAMATIFSPLHEVQAEELRRVTEVTYLGTAYGTLAALGRMRARRRGCIVQVGSALAYRAIPLQGAYCAAKFAIRGLTDALRSELIHDRLPIHLTMVQLPAHNTPQFDWARSRLRRALQPVPPIYQPEIAARAVHHAAYARRRELWVGWPTILAILGAGMFPGYADRRLAKQAFVGQMDARLDSPRRPDNLFAPAPGEYGAHGRFDARSRRHSLMLWLNLNRGRVLTAMLGVATGLGLALARRKATRLLR